MKVWCQNWRFSQVQIFQQKYVYNVLPKLINIKKKKTHRKKFEGFQTKSASKVFKSLKI